MHERAILVPARESVLRVAAEELPDPARGCPARYVCEVRFILVLHSLAEELLGKSPPRRRRVLEVGVESLERARAQARLRSPCPEAPDFCLLEQVVTGEDFICALAREHYLVTLGTHTLRQQHEGRRRSANDRRLGVPDRASEGRADVFGRAMHRRMMRAEIGHELLLVRALVEFAVLKRYRERSQWRVGEVLDDCGEHGGVEPAAEVRPYRSVGPQLEADRVYQQGAQFLGACLGGARIV